MGKSIKGSKGPGYDYGSKRYGNSTKCNSPGTGVKQLTNRAERRIGKMEASNIPTAKETRFMII